MLTKNEVTAIMETEFAEYLNRCAAKGVGRADAEVTLSNKLFMSSLQKSCAAERAKTAVADQLRETAFEASRSKDTVAYKAACEAWLLESRKVAIGDVARVYGWKDAREILVESFELLFSHDSSSFPCLCFKGPTVRKGRRDVLVETGIVDFDSTVSKIIPSYGMQDYCKALAV